jgi:phospholipid-binding lipoprotein MlaA
MKPFALPIVLAPLLLGCSVAPPGTEIHDPYEGLNRQVHSFNKGLDTVVLRPLSLVAAETPPALTQSVVNFSDNAGLPGAVVNNLLQGDVEGAGRNTLRFVVNTTVGILGLGDPAALIGLEEVETDFGETLAVWGLPEGAYVELPGFGPSTERDAVGRLVDMVIDPLDGLSLVPEPVQELSFPARVAEQVVERGLLGDTIDEILYESADSYAQARLIFLQGRRFEVEAAPEADDESYYFDPYEDQ